MSLFCIGLLADDLQKRHTDSQINDMLNIRAVKKEDVSELGEIFAKVYEVFDVGERWTKESAIILLNHWYHRQPDLAFAAELDGKLVGAFFSGIKPWWDGNRLDGGEIFVHPDHQKSGVGKELFKTMFKAAIEKYDAKAIEAATFKNFEFPLSWYKSIGFNEIQEWVLVSAELKEVLGKLK